MFMLLDVFHVAVMGTQCTTVRVMRQSEVVVGKLTFLIRFAVRSRPVVMPVRSLTAQIDKIYT